MIILNLKDMKAIKVFVLLITWVTVLCSIFWVIAQPVLWLTYLSEPTCGSIAAYTALTVLTWFVFLNRDRIDCVVKFKRFSLIETVVSICLLELYIIGLVIASAP